ncbi:hypothetical protein ACWEO4_21575 [Streptomyces sp. NPDC004393]|uniref:hypothetical protein n=1 Tax=Streptomyces sp. NPDC004533 TaxID=3154278 RepID=UPI0033B0942C
MSRIDAVTQHQRRRLRNRVQRYPGSTAAELSALLSVANRSMFGLVLRSARERRMVRVDDEARYRAI